MGVHLSTLLRRETCVAAGKIFFRFIVLRVFRRNRPDSDAGARWQIVSPPRNSRPVIHLNGISLNMLMWVNLLPLLVRRRSGVSAAASAQMAQTRLKPRTPGPVPILWG